MQSTLSFDSKKLSLLLAFLLVFSGGYWTGRSGFVAQRSSTGPIPLVHQEEGKPKEVDFGLFWDAWKVVDEKYAKEPDDQARLYGAISGMVSSLGDPFSLYMKPSEASQFNQELNGNFEGIGAELAQKDDHITVVRPLEGSPAEKAGLVAGDVITKIDGQDAPASIEEAVKLIRGPKGTQVKLTLKRNEQTQEVTITRQNVEVQSATYTKKDTIGLIKLNQFNANTDDLLGAALKKAEADHVKGIVIDLRNNPGGLLNLAVSMTSRFIEPGVVVVERDRSHHDTELKTVPAERVTLPIVVLINKGSASASEIFAGAIQDAGRGKIVGETSFGKGSVQSIEPLKDGSAVRITVAEWLTPKKREINKHGIQPDVEVKLSDDDIKNGRDPQLDKALELLK